MTESYEEWEARVMAEDALIDRLELHARNYAARRLPPAPGNQVLGGLTIAEQALRMTTIEKETT